MNLERINEIKEEISICTHCELYKTRQNTVPGWFPETSKPLLFIGEAPSLIEDFTGSPMLGSSGKLFTKIIYDIFSFERKDYSITYCAKCITINKLTKERKRPSSTTLLWCASYLFEQIECFDPKLIITLGYIPHHIFLNSETINFFWKDKHSYNNDIGKLFKTKSMISDKSFSYIPLYDPYSWIAKKELKEQSINGLIKAKKIFDELN